jgi:hypothetical protein
VADRALDMLKVDGRGFDHMDRRLLLAVIEKFDGGPVGVDSLAAAIGEERGTIEDVLEPFLIQQGYMMRTPARPHGHAQCLPARLDEDLHATATVTRLGGASLELWQRVRRGSEVLVEGTVTIACVDPATLKPRRIPRDMLAKLRGASPSSGD